MSAIVRRNQGWVPSILGDLLGGEWLDTRTPSGIIPAINVKETKKDYLVEVAAPGLTKEEWFVKNKAFYERLFPAMERCGVNVLCENSTFIDGMYFINTGKDMRAFIDFVDHPMIHGCWDTGHANCEGPQYDDIMALGDELYAIHYNDNRGVDDEHVAPFLGTMNHDEVMHALIDVNYKGYFTLECDSTLRRYDQWTGKRRRFEQDKRLSEPQLFMQRHIEKMLKESSEWILSSYGLLEE